MKLTDLKLSDLLEAQDETIRRNAISISKRLIEFRDMRMKEMQQVDEGNNVVATVKEYRDWADEEVLENL